MRFQGWLLDLYAGRQVDRAGRAGVILWFLGEDGQRYRLHQPFSVTFYAAGPEPILAALSDRLQAQPVPLSLERTARRDLFAGAAVPLLGVHVHSTAAQPRLFRQVSEVLPRLTYYDADIPLALRYAALHGVFPLAYCDVEAGGDGALHALQALDSPWDLDVPPVPLRVLSFELDDDPAHTLPRQLTLRTGRYEYRLDFSPERPFLVNLSAILNRHDPDLLLTDYGDTWLLPRLLAMAKKAGFSLPLNRDLECEVLHRKERSYFSYGQVIYRGRQVHLFGRWHIDRHNAMLWGDYALDGVLEIARVTSLPVQTAARVSPGSGISAMQMLTALRGGTLVPWHKQQAELPKRALDLFSTDQGGLVYQPTIGLHRDVAEIDFISMYPSIMVRFNISPETVTADRPDALNLAEVDPAALRGEKGLVPQTLAPLLAKRLQLKLRLAELPAWNPLRGLYKAQASSHKWLLVTCFGYLGYKNARFGRIEAHEAVTSYGREALLRAKEAAEDLGFTVLHMYVDGLWVKREGASAVADFQPLLDEIAARTHLDIALDGIFDWVAFLPSRMDERVPVANRYFGLFRDGTLKMRGIELRRRDTPIFAGEAQLELLELLARCTRSGELDDPAAALGQAVALLRRKLASLRQGKVPLHSLLVKQKLSRTLEEYRAPSPPARALQQLQTVGKRLSPGQTVRFVYTLGEPGVHAWDLSEPLDPRSIDVPRYTELLLRAAAAVLGPFGMSEWELRQRVLANALAQPLRLEPPRRRLPSGWAAGSLQSLRQ